MQEELGKNVVTIIDVSKLKIYECEGNLTAEEMVQKLKKLGFIARLDK